MTKIFSARLDEGVLMELEDVTRRLGVTKRKFLEEAIHERAAREKAGPKDDVWAQTCGAWKRKESPAETVRKIKAASEKAYRRHFRG